MKKTRKRQLSLILAAALMVSVSGPGAEAKSKLALNRKKVTLQQGKSFRLKVKGTKKKVKWASSRKKVAVVNKKGKITLYAPSSGAAPASLPIVRSRPESEPHGAVFSLRYSSYPPFLQITVYMRTQ